MLNFEGPTSSLCFMHSVTCHMSMLSWWHQPYNDNLMLW